MVKNSIIWIIGLAIALTSGLTAMGAIAKNKAPELAVNLSPTNGFAAGKIASESIRTYVAENSGQFPDHIGSTATKLAREAFIAEPITPEAVAVLAFGKADQDKRKLMNEALLLSRRQPLVTAWMIADSGVREDMPALLNHYDTMLRTNKSAAPVIISLMADTLANDNFVAPFANLLIKQPPWAYLFWRAVAGKPESIGNAARLREMLYKPDESGDIYRDANLIRALVRNKQFETAEALYKLFVGRKEAGSLLKNGSFEAEPAYPPIDWQLFSTGEYGAVVAGGNLQISAIANSGGVFARQLARLPSEILQINTRFASKIPSDADIEIRISCAEITANPPLTVRIPLVDQMGKLQISNEFSGCSYFWFDIIGRVSESGDGFDTILESISLRPET